LSSNYDNAAWFYDRLSRVVFGNTLKKAQTTFLPLINPQSKILIAGGGTGWIIEELGKIHPTGLNITYVELSEKMMAKARKRNARGNTITYINQPVEETELSSDFDYIITPFLLDSIPHPAFKQVFNSMHNLLKTEGLWLNTDFQLTGKWWQKPLLKGMYLFFKLMGCTNVTELPAIKQQFTDTGYITIAEQTFFGKLILAGAYSKM